jgi:predicted transcriptional regulator with HTH domain
MSNQTTWIKEIAQEINSSVNQVKTAIQETGMEINCKEDVLISFGQWAVNKLKDRKTIEDLQALIRDLYNMINDKKNELQRQMKEKDELIDTQNKTIAIQANKIAELETELRKISGDLPLASGE